MREFTLIPEKLSKYFGLYLEGKRIDGAGINCWKNHAKEYLLFIEKNPDAHISVSSLIGSVYLTPAELRSFIREIIRIDLQNG